MDWKENYGAAVDVGATRLRVAVGLSNGRVLSSKSEPTDTVSGPDAISRQITIMIRSLQAELKLPPTRLAGIGIGSIGPLDSKRGGVDNPANIPHYAFIPLVAPLKTEFMVAVTLLNDCVAGVIGEKLFGLGTSFENLVYVTISTGIGGGAYVDGHLLLGKDGNAHEIGHTVIDSQGRLLCGCGKKGHWEAYCSGKNIPNYAMMLLEEAEERSLIEGPLYSDLKRGSLKITAKNIFDGAKSGDNTCRMIVESVGRLNAIGFANVVNVYDPSLITVGGAVTLRNPNLVLNPIISHIDEYIFNKPPTIKLTPLGDGAVIYGALAAAFNLHLVNCAPRTRS